MMPKETTRLALLEILLPMIIETAVLEALEYMHSPDTLTAEEVLEMVAVQRARKDAAMARYNELKAQITGG